MICAITLALIGLSGLDEDKCLGSERESVAPTGSERKAMSTNGTPDVTGLESLIFSQTFCPLDHTMHRVSNVQHTNTETVMKLEFKEAACSFERAAEDVEPHERLES